MVAANNSQFVRSADRPHNPSGPSLSSVTSDGGLSFLKGGIRPPTPSYDWTKGADPRRSPCNFRLHGWLLSLRVGVATRRQHLARMLPTGPGSPDPATPYHMHWATCHVGEAAPALAGEAIEPGVTVVCGVHWCGHPPPDQDDPALLTPQPHTPQSESPEGWMRARSEGGSEEREANS